MFVRVFIIFSLKISLICTGYSKIEYHPYSAQSSGGYQKADVLILNSIKMELELYLRNLKYFELNEIHNGSKKRAKRNKECFEERAIRLWVN